MFILIKIIYASNFYEKNYDSIKSISDVSTLSENDSSKGSFIEMNKENEIIEEIRKLIKNEQTKELYFFIKNQDYKKHHEFAFLKSCLQEISESQIEITEKKSIEDYIEKDKIDFKDNLGRFGYKPVKLNSLRKIKNYYFYEEKFFILKHVTQKTPESCHLLLDYYTPLNFHKIIDILDHLDNKNQLTYNISEKFVINIILHHSLYDIEEYQWILKKHIHEKNKENIKKIIKNHKNEKNIISIVFN